MNTLLRYTCLRGRRDWWHFIMYLRLYITDKRDRHFEVDLNFALFYCGNSTHSLMCSLENQYSSEFLIIEFCLLFPRLFPHFISRASAHSWGAGDRRRCVRDDLPSLYSPVYGLNTIIPTLCGWKEYNCRHVLAIIHEGTDNESLCFPKPQRWRRSSFWTSVL